MSSRLLSVAASLLLSGASITALAQTAPAPPAPPPASTTIPAAAPPAPPADPVVARVNGQDVHLSDVTETVRGLPENMRGMPQQMLLPMVQERQVDFLALVAEAKKAGLEKDPAVQKQIARSTDAALQNAWLTRIVGPKVTEEAIRAKYDSEIAGKQGEEEVHARHILVASETEAKKVIADLKKGGDFATEAKKVSTDPGGKEGGDLGWFKRADMVPPFSEAAFAMKQGDISQTPVHSDFGWHVIKVEGRRQAPAPTFEESRDALRQQMIQEAVQAAVKQARADATIETFSLDGSPLTPKTPDAPAATGATPPPAKP